MYSVSSQNNQNLTLPVVLKSVGEKSREKQEYLWKSVFDKHLY